MDLSAEATAGHKRLENSRICDNLVVLRRGTPQRHSTRRLWMLRSIPEEGNNTARLDGTRIRYPAVLRRVALVVSFWCVKLKHIEPDNCLVPKRHLEDP